MYDNYIFQQLVKNFDNTKNDDCKTQLVSYIFNNLDNLSYMCIYLQYIDNNNKNKYYKTLINNTIENYKLKKNINSLIEDNNLNYTQKINRKDDEYKNKIKEMYYSCQVTNTHIIGCQVAHILEFKNCENDNDRYNKFNGLLLKAQIHLYWDSNFLQLKFDEYTKDIYITVNINKLNNLEDKDNLLECLLSELNIKNENEKCFINYDKKHFESYSYYIKRRNNYL